MRVAPLPDDRQYLGIAAAVVAGDPVPGADRSAKAAGEIGVLAQLALGGNEIDAVFAQHLRRDDAIGLARLVAGGVILPIDVELPGLAGEPRIDAALDRAEVRAHKDVSRFGAQRCPGKFGRDRERSAPPGGLAGVAGEERAR